MIKRGKITQNKYRIYRPIYNLLSKMVNVNSCKTMSDILAGFAFGFLLQILHNIYYRTLFLYIFLSSKLLFYLIFQY